MNNLNQIGGGFSALTAGAPASFYLANANMSSGMAGMLNNYSFAQSPSLASLYSPGSLSSISSLGATNPYFNASYASAMSAYYEESQMMSPGLQSPYLQSDPYSSTLSSDLCAGLNAMGIDSCSSCSCAV